VGVTGEICMFSSLREPEEMNKSVERVFLSVWNVPSFSVLETASRTRENCESMRRLAGIAAPMILVGFIWFFIIIQYEYQVSTQRNII
jgi:hypothetical protein